MLGVPDDEVGKPCYMMVGDSIKYEPAFLESKVEVKELQLFKSSECSVSLMGKD